MPGHCKRRQFKQTDAFTRGMVIGLKRAGWSIRQIAADTHLDASTVHRLWRRWLEQGNVAIYRNVGATRVTSARVDRRILRQAVAAPQATCTAILQHVQDTLNHSISTRTISRRLVANGLHSCRPLRRLPLTPPNRRQRLEWCRARSTWMTEWHRVVFSDESRFCLSSGSRRVRVWRRRGERSNPAAIVERPTGTMTAQRYADDVLRPVTLPYLQGMLPWPPYSPDLSLIEHVWDIIGRRLHALPQPRSEDELWQMVERKWRAIPQDAIRTLIDSLPRRVAACIAVRDEKLSRTQVYFWYKRFKDGRIRIADDSRSGLPLTSTTDRNIGQGSSHIPSYVIPCTQKVFIAENVCYLLVCSSCEGKGQSRKVQGLYCWEDAPTILAQYLPNNRHKPSNIELEHCHFKGIGQIETISERSGRRFQRPHFAKVKENDQGNSSIAMSGLKSRRIDQDVPTSTRSGRTTYEHLICDVKPFYPKPYLMFKSIETMKIHPQHTCCVNFYSILLPSTCPSRIKQFPKKLQELLKITV
ncbi:Transposase [Cordylochernes scorpioides]|uniref:Transposase n=1 Tax=Cordylochernes scorpioides TaxID=51811 RepID=A0ABY6L6Y2_9ARAC|nr:Transposase [Cordylochernes scorpioides]